MLRFEPRVSKHIFVLPDYPYLLKREADLNHTYYRSYE